MSNYSAPTRHPVTGAIEMAEWLDDHDGKHRYGVRFPSDGKIYGGNECVEVRPREMMIEIERLRADNEPIERMWLELINTCRTKSAKIMQAHSEIERLRAALNADAELGDQTWGRER
jgi:hypothetical protein